MSSASIRVEARARPWAERLQPWIAALVSALLHLLMLLLLLFASTPTVTTPQGTAGGGRMKVEFVGETRQPVQPVTTKPSPPTPQKPKPVRKRPATSPVRSTLVQHADDPVPPEAPDTPGTVVALPPTPVQPPSVPSPPQPQNKAPPSQAQAPAASPPASTQRRPETWTGRPPGMLDQDIGQDEGLARSASTSRGRRNDLDTAEPSLEVGGYQVYYDLRSETQLRAWMAEGMKELSLPLPGTQYFMVCPAQVALDRGSGKCRLVGPDSSELKTIGDAREVINMIQVYRRGELVWRGPGPYR